MPGRMPNRSDSSIPGSSLPGAPRRSATRPGLRPQGAHPDTIVLATPAEPHVSVGFHQDLEAELDLPSAAKGLGEEDPPLVFSDTWKGDGRDWTQRSPTNGPSGRSGHAMAYDVARRRMVLFGGLLD